MAVYGNTGSFKSCLPLLANDAATLAKYGRFLEAIGRRVVADARRPQRSAGSSNGWSARICP